MHASSKLISKSIIRPCFSHITHIFTLRKICPYSEFSGPYFLSFGLNTGIYPYSVRMRENANQKNFKYGHFSRSVSQLWRRLKISLEFLLYMRSSHQRCSVRKGVPKILAKFTGKHLNQSLFFGKVKNKRLKNETKELATSVTTACNIFLKV